MHVEPSLLSRNTKLNLNMVVLQLWSLIMKDWRKRWNNYQNLREEQRIQSNVLKGLNLEDIKRAGERLILHDGWMGFFQNITKNENLNVHVHVLSYCWCADLIRSAFSSGMIISDS